MKTNLLFQTVAFLLLISCTKPANEPEYNTDNKFVNITPNFVTGELSSIWFFNNYKGIITSNSGQFISTNNSGKTWADSNLFGATRLDQLFFSDAEFGFCTDSDTNTYIYDTLKWSYYPFPVKKTVPSCIQMLNENVIFSTTLLGENPLSYALKTNDAGISWDTIFSTNSDIQQIVMLNEMQGFLLINKPGKIELLKTNDGGISWFGRIPSIYGTYFSNTNQLVKLLALDNEHLIVVTRGEKQNESMIFTSIDAGENWQMEIINNSINDIYATSENLFLVGDELFVAQWKINKSEFANPYNIIDNWRVFDRKNDFLINKNGTPELHYHNIIHVQFVSNQEGFIITNKQSNVYSIKLNPELLIIE